jgi:hypothetical protein
MREPTKPMLEAFDDYNEDHITGEWTIAEAWNDMIDAALKEEPT